MKESDIMIYGLKIIFDKSNPNWSPNEERNLMFIRYTENLLNSLLKYRGYVFLMDIYDNLGEKFKIENYLNRSLNFLTILDYKALKIELYTQVEEDGSITIIF